MESEYCAAIVVPVGIAAGEISSGVNAAAQAINTRVVIFAAAAIMIIAIFSPGAVVRATRRIRQRSEIVIERMVLLHDHDNVFGFVRIAFSHGCGRSQQDCGKKQVRKCKANAEPTHNALLFL
jgi:hypothetical protein